MKESKQSATENNKNIPAYFGLSRMAALDVKWVGRLETSRTPSFAQKPHSNPYYEWLAVSAGPVYLQVNGENLALSSGDVILLRPWESHGGWKQQGNGEFFWAQFATSLPLTDYEPWSIRGSELKMLQHAGADLRTGWSAEQDMLLLARRMQVSSKFRLFTLFEQLVEEGEQARDYFRYRQSLLLGAICEHLAAETYRRFVEDPAVPASYQLYRRMVNLIHEAYDRPGITANLEQALARKYSYLCQVFRQYADRSIGAYIRQLRLQRAAYLLAASEHTIAQIAEEVGFSDAFYFSRLFKQAHGLSPSDFRAQPPDTSAPL